MDLLTCRENAEIAAAIPGIRNVMFCSRAAIRLLESEQAMTPVVEEQIDLDLLERLKAAHYRRAIVLRRYITQSTLVLMSAVLADEKICMWQMPTNTSQTAAEQFSAKWTRLTASERIRSEIDYYATVVSRILGREIDSRPLLKLPCGDTAEDGSIVLALGGNSSRWPAMKWVSTARKLRSKGHGPIHLFGGNKYERATALAITIAVPDCINHVGKMKMLDSLPFLRRASLVISNDTGFAHLASLVARRILIVQGGGTFARFFPWPGATNQHVLYKGMTCFDCEWTCRFHNPLQRRGCLKQISADDVVSFAEDILSGDAPRARNVGQDDGHYQLAWRRLQNLTEPMPLSAKSLTDEGKDPFTP